jgi:hypothetical protein
LSLAVALGALLCPRGADAAPGDTPDRCDAAFSAAPDLVKAGRLLEGRAALVVCAAEPCPTSMRSLCARDLQNLDAQLPTVVFVAKSSTAEDVLDAKVTEDGRSIAGRLDGTAVALDPGPHRFHFERPNGASVDVSALLREGEKARAVTAVFSATERVEPAVEEPTRPVVSSRPIPWTVVASGGVAVLAAGSFAVFGIEGLVQRANLASCKGSCSSDQVQPVRDSYRVADVSLAVAGVAAGVTVTLFFTRPTVTVVATGRGLLLDAAF